MNVREKLVDILKQAPFEGKVLDEWWWEEKIKRIADHLISNGITVQALDGCEYCEKYEDLPEHFISDKPAGRVFNTCIQTDENGRWHLEVPSGVDIGIKFCPMCGRKLPHPPKGE